MKKLKKRADSRINGVYGSISSTINKGYPNYPSAPAEWLEWYMSKKPKNAEVILADIPYFMDVVYRKIRQQENKQCLK